MAIIDALKGPVHQPTSGNAAKQAVILLHGYGANGDDLIGLAPFFAEALPDAVFYSPNAPEGLEGGYFGGRQWFTLAGYDPELLRRDPARMSGVFQAMGDGAAKAAVPLNKFIDQVIEHHGIEPSRLALLGFSQGTMMALHVGLRRPQQIGGILGFSGAILAADKLSAEIKSKPPVMLIHGSADPVVPVQALDGIAKALSAADVPFEKHVIPGLQHGIDGAGAQLGARFLKENLADG